MTDTPPLLAWHGSDELKADAVARMRAHRDADDFRQGDYLTVDDGGQWKGCFHGCLTADVVAAERGVTVTDLAATRGWASGITWWREAERVFGIPRDLCALLDGAFEGIDTVAEAGQFAIDAIEAIPVGADLSGLADKIYDEAYDDATDGFRAASVLELLKAAPVPAAAQARS